MIITRTIMLLLYLFAICAYSQIKLIITPQDQKCMSDCKIKITLKNVSKDDYIIPIDTSGLKAFDRNIFWLDFKHSKRVDKSLCVELLLKEKSSDTILEAVTRKKDIDLNTNHLDSLFSVIKKEKTIYEEKIHVWKSENNIKDIWKAEKNMYIIQNLLFLKSKKQFSYYVDFDTSFDLENNYSSEESYYIIQPQKKYDAIIKLTVPFDITSYLTKEQIKRYKKYKIFKGDIVAKPLRLLLENNKYHITE
ncbi:MULTISPECIES: hypothetical protein [Chryseobacterium]|uniref:Uncharacterized protein n=1 Tax=Chryseobacterium taihuense TaxID=1141221 RepID=A0A4U8WN06_9FLAO|nr:MULTISPECIES: hypothetical protein [Chryseobacterium]QQV02987.1 hypothetical protein I6I61_01085 [Chryseobacterium sp. FDAARGOS 1104]VFB03729.1 Uncharacterised protein [Chryseobacterium taihuense]